MEQKQNKMGVVPVPKLMLSMGVPMIISMIVQAFYNIVDSYFVSNMTSDSIPGLGDYAINALTLSFPIQMLMIAIGVGTGVGINSLLSKYLGEQEHEKANWVAGNAIFTAICTYVVFLIFGIVGSRWFLQTQTSDPMVIELGCSYLSICCIWSFGSIGSMIYEKLLQGTGKTHLSTIGQLAGAITNIVLDPILIYGWLGLPEMGVTGAAIATVIGQILTLLLMMFFHYRYNKEINGSLQYIRPKKQTILGIYRVGAPAIVMQALMSVMSYGINIIFGFVSAAAVTAFGIYYKIQQFVFFAAFGMNNAMIPIIAFNYGKPICSIFSLSEESNQLCIHAIRIVTLGYLFAGANIAYQGIFQALGCGVKSLLLLLARLIVVTLPLAWVFTLFDQAANLIWLCFPIAEVCGLIVALAFMRVVQKQKIQSIGQ